MLYVGLGSGWTSRYHALCSAGAGAWGMGWDVDVTGICYRGGAWASRAYATGRAGFGDGGGRVGCRRHAHTYVHGMLMSGPQRCAGSGRRPLQYKRFFCFAGGFRTAEAGRFNLPGDFFISPRKEGYNLEVKKSMPCNANKTIRPST